MEGNPDPPLTIPPDKQSNSIDTADDLIHSEHVVDGTQDRNKSTTGSVYAVHDTAEHEESGEVTTESSSEDEEEYEYTNGFYVNNSHDNLLTQTTDNQQDYKAAYHAATQKFDEETKRYETQVLHLLLLNDELKIKHSDFESTS